jgi:hypothetical protein
MNKISSHPNENNREKNNGYLVVEKFNSELIVVQNENIDQQTTQHAQPCVHGQLNEDNFELNHTQVVPSTPNEVRLPPPILGSARMAVANRKLEFPIRRKKTFFIFCCLFKSQIMDLMLN